MQPFFCSYQFMCNYDFCQESGQDRTNLSICFSWLIAEQCHSSSTIHSIHIYHALHNVLVVLWGNTESPYCQYMETLSPSKTLNLTHLIVCKLCHVGSEYMLIIHVVLSYHDYTTENMASRLSFFDFSGRKEPFNLAVLFCWDIWKITFSCYLVLHAVVNLFAITVVSGAFGIVAYLLLCE